MKVMKHNIIHRATVIFGLAALIISCTRNEETSPFRGRISIIPDFTKVTEDRFETDDAIGVNISLASGAYATNQKMVYNGSFFSSDLQWYEGSEKSTIAAWHPWSESVPQAFSVQTDQSEGLSPSDFVAGSLDNARPSESPLKMKFSHRMSRLEISVINNTGKEFDNLLIGGVAAEALLSEDFVASASPSAPKVAIKPYMSGAKYFALIPPQTASLEISFTLDGSGRSLTIPSVVFPAGASSRIELTETTAKLTGIIQSWEEGTSYKARPSWEKDSKDAYIDGDFSDWDAIEGTGEFTAAATGYGSVRTIKTTSDEDYIYLYAEILTDALPQNSIAGEWGDSWNGVQGFQGDDNNDYISGGFLVFFDPDGNSNTGFYPNDWDGEPFYGLGCEMCANEYLYFNPEKRAVCIAWNQVEVGPTQFGTYTDWGIMAEYISDYDYNGTVYQQWPDSMDGAAFPLYGWQNADNSGRGDNIAPRPGNIASALSGDLVRVEFAIEKSDIVNYSPSFSEYAWGICYQGEGIGPVRAKYWQ